MQSDNTLKDSEEFMVRSPTTKRARSPSIRNVFESKNPEIIIITDLFLYEDDFFISISDVNDSRSSSFGITTGE